MSDPRSDPRLHDYLDGRLDDDERRAFERQLGSDAELRERLESYRALGDDLREPLPPLDEDFYAAARQRFRRRLPRSSTRPATWEIAGLAAAALLIFGLLVPQLWEEERIPVPPTMEPAAPAPPPAPISETIDRAEMQQKADAPAPSGPPPEEPVRQVAAKREAAEVLKKKSVGYVADEAPPVAAGERRDNVAKDPRSVAGTPLPIRTIEIRADAFADFAETEKERAGAKARPQVAERARLADDDAAPPAEREFRVEPRPDLTDCGDLRARRIDGRIEIGLSRTVAGRHSGGAIACLVLLPPGEEPVSWIEDYLD